MKKKDKEERKEKIIKGVKIGAYCTGLTLCTGLFVALLVVGIRGCASTPRSNTTESAATNRIDTPSYAPLREYNDLSRSDNYYVYNGYRLDGRVYTDYFTNGNYDIWLPINGKIISHYDNINVFNFDISYFRVESYTNDVFCWTIETKQGAYFELTYENDNNRIVNSDYYGYEPINRVYIYFENAYILNEYEQNETYKPAVMDLKAVLNNDYVKGYNFNVLFNNVINPFGPLGATFDYFVNQNISGGKVLFRGLFTDSLGNYYSGIQLYYLGANGMRFGTSTDYSTYTGDGSHYMTMSFLTIAGNQVTVNAQDYVTATSGSQSGNTVMSLLNHWISNIYQNINIIWLFEDSYSTGYSGSMDRLTAITSLNNNVAGYSGIINGGSSGAIGVFDLIGSAFSSFATIFAVQIIPGVTIWTLLLIPFVVTIILFAVWLFKR